MDFGPLGVTEILLIVALALVVFGPRRLPELGRRAAEIVTRLRRGTQDLRRALEVEVDAAAGEDTVAAVRSAAAEVDALGQGFEAAARRLVRLDERAAPRGPGPITGQRASGEASAPTGEE